MKEIRSARSVRERKSQLTPEAERLVAAALGLANSGSRTEDLFWERQLEARLDRLLSSAHGQTVHDALERLSQTDLEAYGALIEAVENQAEAVRLEHNGQWWDVLLVTAPLVAWTRFSLPTGPMPAAKADQLAAIWRDTILAPEVCFGMVPSVLSVEQLPHDFSELRRWVKRVGALVLDGQRLKADSHDQAEVPDMLADCRFLLGVVAVPQGSEMFRWQLNDSAKHRARVQCAEDWVAKARPLLETLLPGCGFESLLPDAFHINMREADRRVRPYAVRASVNFLTENIGAPADSIRAAIAAFGEARVEEYRIGLMVGDTDEVAQGVVWPLLGSESERDEVPPLDVIRDILKESGISDVRVWSEIIEPEYCEDCGAPLFPNNKHEVVHAELPEDVETTPQQFH